MGCLGDWFNYSNFKTFKLGKVQVTNLLAAWGVLSPAIRGKLGIKQTNTSLVAQWLRLRAPNAGVLRLIPGQGTRSHMHAETKSSHATTKEPVSHN